MASENMGNKLQEVSNQEKLKILGFETLQDCIKDGYKTLMGAIKHSNSLPQGSDWNFYNTHDSFVQIINEESGKVLKQINTLLRTNQIEENIRNRGLEEKTELIVEGNDNILERVANNIDEMNGIKQTGNAPILIQSVSAELPVNGSWNRVNSARFSVTSSITTQDSSKRPTNAIRLLTAKNIIRPQKFFKDKIVNSSSFPWEPRIKDKPNAMKPLAIFLEQTANGEEYSHPYEFELDRFTPLAEQLQKESPVNPLPVEDTPLVEVTKPDQLDDLVETLRKCTEFAVDVEHHSYRSFMGITCLLQISTRDTDYLIDTLALRDKLWILNEVFTKPTIVKIFHGADMDIQWLQRDLSIYVVNMFDTFQAAKQLEFSGLSLAYLMQRFCNFVPNKQFQLADWRIRPLPNELKSYAREDTHYLIYIYQMLKNELLDRANGFPNILLSVINKSTDVCKQRYFKPVLREDTYMDFYRKCKRTFDNRQLYALKELYRWRDQLSREEDESTGYVLPNHMLLQIAETLPREMQGVLACCNPIPPLVRSNLLELHQIVLKAKEQPLEKPIFKQDTRARGNTKKISKINVDSPLNCPHDLTKSNDFRDDLPTILGNKINSSLVSLPISKLESDSAKPKLSVFFTPDNSDEEQKNKIKEKLHTFKFLGPFERYKLVRPYIQAEEEKLAKVEPSGEDSEILNAVTADDTRTDEERIQSIRELFLTLSRKGPPNAGPLEPDRSLVQMGGTKRKREPSPSVREQSESIHPIFLPISNSTSNISNDVNTRKRKSSDGADGATPAKIKNKKKQKKQWEGKANWPRQENEVQHEQRQESDQQRVAENEETPYDQRNQRDQQQFRNQHNKRGQQKRGGQQTRGGQQSKRNQQNQRGQQNKRGQQNIEDQQNRRGQQDRGNQQKRRNRQNRGSKQNNHEQQNQQKHLNEEQQFTPFDYSSVDFRQFQGGAGSVSKPQEVKSTVRFKGKKKGANKGNNRSATFGNSSQSRGRGRGR